MDFLIQCKNLYDKGITPLDINRFDYEEFNKLITIANTYIGSGDICGFKNYFKEGSYYVQLWAAHLVIDQARVDRDIQKEAYSIVEKYANRSMSDKVREEEKKWLANNPLSA